MSLLRSLVAGLAVIVAVVLQVTVFSHLSWAGVVPNLGLLVVVAAALSRGPQFAMVVGFAAGLLLDLAPPADHVAGRWALALVIVGYLAGRVRQETQFGVDLGRRPPAMAALASVLVCSVLGTSLFCFSGLLLGDLDAGFSGLLQVIGIAAVLDLLVSPLVLPPLLLAFGRLEPRAQSTDLISGLSTRERSTVGRWR